MTLSIFSNICYSPYPMSLMEIIFYSNQEKLAYYYGGGGENVSRPIGPNIPLTRFSKVMGNYINSK